MPHIPNAIPFYQFISTVWLPVGIALDIKGLARENYLDEIRRAHDLGREEIFIVPQFKPEIDETDRADIFTIAQKLKISQLLLEPLR